MERKGGRGEGRERGREGEGKAGRGEGKRGGKGEEGGEGNEERLRRRGRQTEGMKERRAERAEENRKM